jgi:hypothetical protein
LRTGFWAADRLDVVVEDVRTCLHDRPQRPVGAIEVRDEDLYAHLWALAAKGSYGLGEDVRAAIGQVVAGDAGHDHVLEVHLADGLGDAARLVLVVPGRATGLDGAEAAGARAGVTEDHDRCRALLPALPDVGAAGLLADGVQGQVAQDALEVVIVGAGRQPGPDPLGVPTHGHRSVGRRPCDGPAAHGDGQRFTRGVAVIRSRRREDRQLATHQLQSGMMR